MIRAILTSGSMRSLRQKPDRSCATKPGHISCHRQAEARYSSFATSRPRVATRGSRRELEVEPAITLAAVASSGLTVSPAAWWAERQQAHSAAEYCLGRGRGHPPAPGPASRSAKAGGLALD